MVWVGGWGGAGGGGDIIKVHLKCKCLSSSAVPHEANLAELACAHHPEHLQVFEGDPSRWCLNAHLD